MLILFGFRIYKTVDLTINELTVSLEQLIERNTYYDKSTIQTTVKNSYIVSPRRVVLDSTVHLQ
jgi:hypothetical protein